MSSGTTHIERTKDVNREEVSFVFLFTLDFIWKEKCCYATFLTYSCFSLKCISFVETYTSVSQQHLFSSNQFERENVQIFSAR